MNQPRQITVIMCSADSGKASAAENHWRAHYPDREIEIIRISDARSMSEGYNRALDQCRGDVLIFSHDDVQLRSQTVAKQIDAASERFDVFGVVGTTLLTGPAWMFSGPPHAAGQVAHFLSVERIWIVSIYGVHARIIPNVHAIDGVMMVATRQAATSLRFDAELFDGFHLYDIDFSFRAHRAGMKVGVVCDLLPFHQSTGNFNPPWNLYAGKFVTKHFAALPRLHQARGRFAEVIVTTEEEAIPVMTPPYWDLV